MTAAPALRAGQDLADAYLEALEAAGMYVGPPVVSVTRVFFDRIGADGWADEDRRSSPVSITEIPQLTGAGSGWCEG